MIAAGLPNITGAADTLVQVTNTGGIFTGAFKWQKWDNASSDIVPGNNNDSIGKLNFNANDSNIIYGSSETVQPPAITLLPQIKF